MKFEAEGQEFANNLFKHIQTFKQNDFCEQNAILTCFWRFVSSNKLDQLELKLKFLGGFRNMQEKLEKECEYNFITFFTPLCVYACIYDGRISGGKLFQDS